jgi:photosystem II stability/assembly factor-like uncharacterized protein
MKYISISILLFFFIFTFFLSSCKDNSTGTEDNSPFYPVILKTTDGGNTWNKISHGKFETVPSFAELTDLNFFNVNAGIAVGREGIMYRYDAASDFWWKVQGLENINFTSIEIIDSNSCIAVGNVNSNGSRIIRSNDKGVHWSLVDENNSGNLVKVNFTDPQHGFILASNNYLYKTIDYGSTWNWYPIQTASPAIWDLEFITSEKGFAVGSYSRAYISRTTNGGINWTSDNIFLGTAQSVYRIKFYNTTLGFAIGGSNVILKTSDGGDTWNTITVSQNSNIVLRDIAIASENKILIIGINTLYKSEDGGLNWTSNTFPTPEYPMVIRFIDVNTGYIAGRFDLTSNR